MKRTLKLTLNEIKRLKWTVLVTALALVLFTASLFSVIFVYNDLSVNVFNYFDSTDEPLSFYATSASASMITPKYQDGLIDGTIEGLTRNATLTANGNSMPTEYEETDENGVTSVFLEKRPRRVRHRTVSNRVRKNFRPCSPSAQG